LNVPKSYVDYDHNGIPIPGSYDPSGAEDREEDEEGNPLPEPVAARLVMRQENTHRVILNTVIIKALKFEEKPSNTAVQILFTAFEETKPINMLLKVCPYFEIRRTTTNVSIDVRNQRTTLHIRDIDHSARVMRVYLYEYGPYDIIFICREPNTQARIFRLLGEYIKIRLEFVILSIARCGLKLAMVFFPFTLFRRQICIQRAYFKKIIGRIHAEIDETESLSITLNRSPFASGT
jgi:hypothetical protein